MFTSKHRQYSSLLDPKTNQGSFSTLTSSIPSKALTLSLHLLFIANTNFHALCKPYLSSTFPITSQRDSKRNKQNKKTRHKPINTRITKTCHKHTYKHGSKLSCNNLSPKSLPQPTGFQHPLTYLSPLDPNTPLLTSAHWTPTPPSPLGLSCPTRRS